MLLTPLLLSSAADGWAGDTSRVPFLQRFVYTAHAPTALLNSWGGLTTGATTDGPLAQVRAAADRDSNT